MSETSTSTEIRQINDTNTNVPRSATTYAIGNTCPSNLIGKSFNVQTHFSLNKFPNPSDIKKAYLRIIVDDVTTGLRIFVRFDKDDVEMKYPVYYLRRTMDFGDGVASAILTIAQNKIIAPLCKFAMSRRIIISQAYADNY